MRPRALLYRAGMLLDPDLQALARERALAALAEARDLEAQACAHRALAASLARTWHLGHLADLDTTPPVSEDVRTQG